KMARQDKMEMAESALQHVGLRGKEKRLPSEISGGEQERVAIARAVVNNPSILLADEPTGNLDTKTSGEIMDLFQALNNDGMTIVMVTHSPDCARIAGRTLRLSDGLLTDDQGLIIEVDLQCDLPGSLDNEILKRAAIQG
ncbi:MAG: ATP-binding cassette domain-containing protein, partial [Deltaproteobacteria bacterium]|nr:ATP-binding cassette domain-containing protein [Deltaproteobacteria bacterium]